MANPNHPHISTNNNHNESNEPKPIESIEEYQPERTPEGDTIYVSNGSFIEDEIAPAEEIQGNDREPEDKL